VNDRDLFVELIEDALPDQIISNFILIAEVTKGEGRQLAVVLSPEITPWLADGMISSATQFMFDNEE